MPITEFLERNARQYPNDVCLVEINPEIKEDRRVTWKEYELIEASPKTSYRREITWSVRSPGACLMRKPIVLPICCCREVLRKGTRLRS